ncbi:MULTISPECIES: BMP family protein [unclassified Bacillus (in: firmicutes)]|uniref:BMP family protein n=1 Tax=unclassified Bacillus (in: firmicutes) TaxID=185979 RepID=UPI0008E2EC4E|nr:MULTISPECIES: BMP family protein [unclassified Bacillus (in: firmicutes)]SFA87434.1 basic membrane protein A [Bacillus sp. UNCCL13]SFQ84246.1 basic membrane protein A [Bacillus sp. cl95]
MKKFVWIFAIISILLVGCSAEKTEKVAKNGSKKDSKKIALILPEKIGVNPFFQQMDEGAKKAANEFGVELKTIESTDHAAIEQNLRVAVAEQYDLIITSSFESEDALKKVATENPNQQFAIIDTVIDLPNVQSVTFREYEAAYLLGAAAGLSTKTDKVGMVAAMDIPLLKKWTVAFEQGLKDTNPDAEFLLNFVGGFTDPAKAKELALLQSSKGADFIAGAAAVGDLGVFEAAKEKGFYTAGQDVDRTTIDPEHIVLSQLKGTDTAAYETIKSFTNGNFKTGVVEYGLKEDGVGLTHVTRDSETPLNAFIGQGVVDQVKAIAEEIKSGKREVKNPLAN